MACGKNQFLGTAEPVKGHTGHYCTNCRYQEVDVARKGTPCYACSGNWNRGLKKAVCKWEPSDLSLEGE